MANQSARQAILPVPALTAEEEQACRNRLFGLLRDIRVDTQNLGKALVALRTALDTRTATKQDVVRSIDMVRTVLKGCQTEVPSRYGEIRNLLEIDPETYDAVGDEVTKIWNAWHKSSIACDRLLTTPSLSLYPIDPAAVPALNAQIDAASEQLHEMAKMVAYLTIPHRLNHHLDAIPRGWPLSFAEVFQDELDPDDLKDLFKRLSSYGSLFKGLLDPTTGLVYAASPAPWRRMASAVQAFGLLVFPAVALAIAGVATGRPSDFLWVKVYLAAAVGLILHFLINAIKQSRSNAEMASPLMNWTLWVHVKSFQVTMTIVSLWAAVVGLYFLQGPIFSAANVKTWLPLSVTVGYSLDSIVDLFILRFDSMVNAQLATLKKTLSPASAAPLAPAPAPAAGVPGAAH